jgi:Raf kinase inhibitor-like YbhB/YbcL family protein
VIGGIAALIVALAASGAEVAVMSMTLASSAFAPAAPIPSRYSCDGANVSPPLSWAGVPAGTKSLALIVADPDAPDPKAPKMTWVHWVLYDLPPEAKGLREAIPSKGLPAGTLEGCNDWGKTGYGGPCPPIGRHRYIHTLYALDTVLPDLGNPTRGKLLSAMEGHVLATAELIGTYQRQ